MIRFFVLFLLVMLSAMSYSQSELASERFLNHVHDLTKKLPSTLQEAHASQKRNKNISDSTERFLLDAYNKLANQVKKKSIRLNAMAGYEDPSAKLTLVPADRGVADFFISQMAKFDQLESSLNKVLRVNADLKKLYSASGYLKTWDSIYLKRIPALISYRQQVLLLVQKEISYLKTKYGSSNIEEVQLQLAEAELSTLQKLNMLAAKYKKIVLEDAAEKFQYCLNNPSACAK